MKLKALITIALLSISLVGCSKEEEKSYLKDIENAKEESKSARLEADEISEETALASKFNDIDFSEFAYDSSPVKLMKALNNANLAGEIFGLSEELEDTMYFKDLDDKILRPKVDENGHWEIMMKAIDDSSITTIRDDGLVEVKLNLGIMYHSAPFKIGDVEFTREELMSEKCVKDLERIFRSFEYVDGMSYIASVGLKDASTNNRYNIVLSSEFPTQFNNNKGKLEYSIAYYQMGHDIIDYQAGNLDAITKREEDRKNKANDVVNNRISIEDADYDDKILHITLKTGEELNLKELVDLGSKDNILRELDKLEGIEYSYYKDKKSYEFTDLDKLMDDVNYNEEDIKITGIFKGVYMRVEDNSIKLHTSFTKNINECDIKIDGMDITSKNGKKLINGWDLKSHGFDASNGDNEFDKKYSSYKISVDFDKDLEHLRYISIEKD